jgi:pyruvate dehydrogenase E1 component alpha subunit
MPAVSVDGVNVLAVHDAVRAAVDRARTGSGPTFVEVAVYRFRAHGGAGDDSRTGYRAEAERVAWEAVDPLHLFGEYLTRAGSLDAAAVENMESAIAIEIADAFDLALASPNPTEDDLHKHVYAD